MTRRLGLLGIVIAAAAALVLWPRAAPQDGAVTAPVHQPTLALWPRAVSQAAGVAGSDPQAPPSAVPGELLIRFRPEAPASERAGARRSARARFERALPLRGLELAETEQGQTVVAAIERLERDPDVLYAEPNFRRTARGSVNDRYFPYQWALHNTGQEVRGRAGTPDADVDAPEAWDVARGAGVTVAVVDSGLAAEHPDFTDALWRNPGETGAGRESNRRDDDANGFVDDWRGWDFVAADGDPSDPNGHGTHVAGTIGARAGDGAGVAGLAPASTLMPLRVLDANGSGSVAHVIEAYRYASRQGAAVVNLSLGGAGGSRAERDALAASPGTLFVAAAGNGGDDGVGDDVDQAPAYPCAYDLANVLCVAATDQDDRLAGFSNYGARAVDLAAPGTTILSTWPPGLGGSFAYLNGTSMATPHVSAAAALVASRIRDATTAQLRAALLDGVDPVAGLAGKTATAGRLNAHRALVEPVPGTVATPAPPASPPAEEPAPSAALDPVATPAPPATDAPAAPAPAPAPASAAPDTAPPILTVRTLRRISLASLRRRGLVVRLSCSEACRIEARLSRARGARALVARASRRLPVAGSTRFTLRPTRRAALPRARSVRLLVTITARDAAGNTRRVARTVLASPR